MSYMPGGGGGGPGANGKTPELQMNGENLEWRYVEDAGAWTDLGDVTGDAGVDGTNGTNGTNGSNGSNGEGVPVGGTTDQVLAKIDGTDFNTRWSTLSILQGLERAFQGTLSAAIDTNADINYTWNSSVKNGATHTNGQADISLPAGVYLVHCEILVTDGAANNRQTALVWVDRYNDADVLQESFALASSVYIRDDASTYDSGAHAGQIEIELADDDYIVLRNEVLDAQTPSGLNPANTTRSVLRIDRRTISLNVQ